MDARVRELIELIDGGFGQALSMDQLAPMLGVSASRLSHMFKAETGTSPAHYLKTVRMCRAQVFLETTHLSVKEIMVRVGISDASHFVRDFQKVNGRTPARYGAHYLAASKGENRDTPSSASRVAESANR